MKTHRFVINVINIIVIYFGYMARIYGWQAIFSNILVILLGSFYLSIYLPVLFILFDMLTNLSNVKIIEITKIF